MKRSGITRKAPLRRDPGEARLTVKAFRPKVCSKSKGGCGEKFTPSRQLQVACGAECAYAIGMRNRLKQDKAIDKDRREKLKTLSQHKAGAQRAMNAWTKLRDAGQNCISCKAPPKDDDQAGHYLTRGARPELALVPINLNRQCLRCNLHLHGNQAAYRIGLVERYGAEAVEELEGPHPAVKWNGDVLAELAATYRAKTRALRKEQA